VMPGNPMSIYPSDPGRPDIVATVGDLAHIKLFASPQLNTAGSYCWGGCTSVPPGGITAVSVFYTSQTSVAMVGVRLNGTPQNCGTQLFPAFCNDPKCYVGRDSNNVVGWAVGSTQQFTSYSAVFAMPMVANIGESTPLYCMNTTTDPMPPGGSFASGAPAIQTSGVNLGNYTLVAQ
jgi:hypothetical protein